MKIRIRTNQSLYRDVLLVPLFPDDSQNLSLVSFPDMEREKEETAHRVTPSLKGLLRKMS